MPEWRPAPDLHELARPLIERHHAHLAGYPLRIVWRDPQWRLKGALVSATAEIVSGRFAHFVMTREEKGALGQDDGPRMFWIEVCGEAWESLSTTQRDALLDHELAHCVLLPTEDGDLKMSIAPHDVEEFQEIVRRHGAWTPQLWEMALNLAEGPQDG